MQTEHDVGHDEPSDPFQFSLPTGRCAESSVSNVQAGRAGGLRQHVILRSRDTHLRHRQSSRGRQACATRQPLPPLRRGTEPHQAWKRCSVRVRSKPAVSKLDSGAREDLSKHTCGCVVESRVPSTVRAGRGKRRARHSRGARECRAAPRDQENWRRGSAASLSEVGAEVHEPLERRQRLQ